MAATGARNTVFAVGASSAVAITVSDATTYLPSNGGYLDAIYIGVAGNVAVMPIGATSAVTFVGAAAGSIIPIQCQQVMSTNTTASSIVGMRY